MLRALLGLFRVDWHWFMQNLFCCRELIMVRAGVFHTSMKRAEPDCVLALVGTRYHILLVEQLYWFFSFFFFIISIVALHVRTFIINTMYNAKQSWPLWDDRPTFWNFVIAIWLTQPAAASCLNLTENRTWYYLPTIVDKIKIFY